MGFESFLHGLVNPESICGIVVVIILIVSRVLISKNRKCREQLADMSYARLSGLTSLSDADCENMDVNDPELQGSILDGIEVAKTYMDERDEYNGQKLKRLDPGDAKCVKVYKLAKPGLRLDNTDAYRLMGDVYYRGAHFGDDRIDKDYGRAWYYYNKALEKDDLIAMFRVGVMYYKGQSVMRDRKKGLELIRKASKLGSPDAKDWLHWRQAMVLLVIIILSSIVFTKIMDTYILGNL